MKNNKSIKYLLGGFFCLFFLFSCQDTDELSKEINLLKDRAVALETCLLYTSKVFGFIMQSLASIRLVIKEYWETAFDIFSVTISSVAAFFKLHPAIIKMEIPAKVKTMLFICCKDLNE